MIGAGNKLDGFGIERFAHERMVGRRGQSADDNVNRSCFEIREELFGGSLTHDDHQKWVVCFQVRDRTG
ncbi:Uncharacterised protein [Mycobacteroides abscessus subsp. abscessus]|nr:Uncharacterised protein [Mycobacteroides abscessus subsp. abscessus]